MKQFINRNKTHILYGIFTVVITFIIVMSCWRLWGTDIKIPLTGYRHDSVGTLLEASNYVRGGSLRKNVNYGAPYTNVYTSGGFGDSSTPMPFIKLIWKLTGSVEAGINIHAILNILLLAISTFVVCVKLKISDFSSMAAGIAYANLSYFLMYANTLLMIYSLCFYIPFFCYIIIDLMREKNEISADKGIKWSKLFFTMFVMLYFGINSAYYSFLALIILAYVTLYTLFVSKQADKVLITVLCIISIGAGIMVYAIQPILHNMGYTELMMELGSLLYVILLAIAIILLLLICALIKKISQHITIKHIYVLFAVLVVLAGAVLLFLKKYTNYFGTYDGRTPIAVELGALRIVNMIMPAPNNLISAVNNSVELITDVNSGDYIIAGVIIGIGFLCSIMNIFKYDNTENNKAELLKICGLLNIFIVIVAIKGGLSSVIAMFITTGIRNYNRMIVFLAVFSLIAFAVILDSVLIKLKNIENSVAKKACIASVYAAVVFLLVLSIPSYFIFKTNYGLMDYDERRADYDEWHRFMDLIESSVPKDSMIMELPFVVDSTHMGILMENSGQAYELAVPAILSKTTSWTYNGSGKSVRWKRVMRQIEDTEEFLLAASAFDIQGIYIDTLMYHDDSYIELLQKIKEKLGEPFVCNQNRRYFFPMTEYNRNLRENYTEEQLEEIKKEIEAQYVF